MYAIAKALPRARGAALVAALALSLPVSAGEPSGAAAPSQPGSRTPPVSERLARLEEGQEEIRERLLRVEESMGQLLDLVSRQSSPRPPLGLSSGDRQRLDRLEREVQQRDRGYQAQRLDSRLTSLESRVANLENRIRSIRVR